MDDRQRLCHTGELIDGGQAVSFDVDYAGQTCRGFAVRYKGVPYAYLNRCTHVGMALDWQPNQIFDKSGLRLMCSNHGATYTPDSGHCVGGPCHGNLTKIALSESDAVVYWHSTYKLKPVQF